MTQNFLAAANQGKNEWWRYLIGISLTLFFYIILGSLAFAVFAVIELKIPMDGSATAETITAKVTDLMKTPSLGGYLSVNMPFPITLVGLFITTVAIHQRKFSSLIRANDPIQWRRMLLGALVWNLILWGYTGVGYLLNPSNFVWSYTSLWWVMVPIALVVTPIQTSCEELFFRGYLMQGMALLMHNRIALTIINGILFMVPHLGNPEMQRGGLMALSYFAMGAGLAAITIRDNGLELAMGIHAANNLQVLFFNPKDSALPFPSLWRIQTPDAPIVELVGTLVAYAIFYYLFFGRQKKNQQV
jgi:uncharacterized protein